MTAFTSYGLFWWSLVLLLVLPNLSFLGNSFAGPSPTALAAYFFMWGVFTFAMFFGTLKANRALQLVFGSLFILFFLLTARELTGNATIALITGIEGIICGASAVYLGLAEVLNESYQKDILPIFAVK